MEYAHSEDWLPVFCKISVKTRDQLFLGTEEKREWGVTNNSHGYSFWRDKNVLKLISGNGCTTLRIY